MFPRRSGRCRRQPPPPRRPPASQWPNAGSRGGGRRPTRPRSRGARRTRAAVAASAPSSGGHQDLWPGRIPRGQVDSRSRGPRRAPGARTAIHGGGTLTSRPSGCESDCPGPLPHMRLWALPVGPCGPRYLVRALSLGRSCAPACRWRRCEVDVVLTNPLTTRRAIGRTPTAAATVEPRDRGSHRESRRRDAEPTIVVIPPLPPTLLEVSAKGDGRRGPRPRGRGVSRRSGESR